MGRDPLFTARFVMLAVAELAYFTGFGMAVHVLPLHVTGRLGAGEGAAGLAFGAFAVSALVARPFAGRWCDLRGRRPLLVAGALLCAAGMAALPLAGSLTEVVLVRLVQGVAEAAFFVGGFAALADLAPPARLGEAISYNSLGLYLGLTLGPLLGERLVDGRDVDLAWYTAAGLGVLAALLALLVGETRDPTTPASAHGTLLHRGALPVSVGFLACLAAVGGFLALATLYAAEVGLSGSSRALVVYGVVVVVLRVLLARLPDRVPPLWLATAALLVVATGMGTMAGWATPGGLLGGAALVGVGVAVGAPAFFTAVFEGVPAAERGAASGTTSAAMDLGLGLGPIGLGLVAGAAGIAWALAAGGLVALAGAGWMGAISVRASRSGR